MNVSVSVVSDKTVVLNKLLSDAKGGKPVRVKAVKGGQYLLAENGSGVGPENITVKRVGKNLHVALEGSDPDQPELIIEEFFGSGGELIGQAEDGLYHQYVAADGDSDSAAAFLMDGMSSPLALGQPQLAGFGEGLVVAGGGLLLPWALAGIGSLVGGAIVEHNKSGDNKPKDTTAPENKGIGSIIDDKGPIKGAVKPGDVIDDGRPTLGGSGQEPGDKVIVSDNGKVIGEVIVDGDGNWTFTPEKDLGDGEHSLEIVVKDPSGNSSDPSEEIVIIIDTTAPTKPGIESIIDDQGPVTGPVLNGGHTDDTQPTLSGKGDVGDVVSIIDNGKVIGQVQVGKDGSWSFTPDKPLSEGEHAFEVVVTDTAGNSSTPSDEYVVVIDTTAPAKPDMGGIIDDQGPITGPVENGGITDDSQPTLTGKGDAGDTVTIIDNGKVVGEVEVGDDGSWTYTPEEPLAEGEHSFEVVVTDPAGNNSGPSDEFVIIVDTTPPAKPGVESVIDDQGAVTGPVTNGGLTDDNQPTLSGKGDAGDTVAIIDNGKVIGEVVVGEDGNWTFTPEEALDEGEHVFEVVITDPAGNSSEPSDEYVVIVDTTPPTNSGVGGIVDDHGPITGPVENGGVTDDSQPTLTGKGDAGDTVTISDNGNVIGEVQVGEDGTWTFTPEVPLAEGEHAFEVVVTDPTGNSTGPSEELVIIVDTTPPAKPGVESVVDDQGAVTGPVTNGGLTDDNQPTLSGKGDAGDTVAIIDNGKVIGEVVVGEDGSWTFTPEEALGEGEHVFEVVITDPAGNSSEPSDEYVVIVDTTPPTNSGIGSIEDGQGAITGPIGNGGYTDDNQPTLTGKGDAGDTVTIIDNGEVVGEVVVDENGNWTFTPEEALTEGEHSFEVVVTDPAGNSTGPSEEFVVVVDTTPPTNGGIGNVHDDQGPVTGPVTNGGTTDDNQPTLSGKGDAGDTVAIIDNGKVIGEVVVGEDGNWSFTPENALDQGEHVFETVITDPAGNISAPSDEYVIIVDGNVPSKPVIESVYDNQGDQKGVLNSGDVTDDNMPLFSGKADPNTTVIIKDGGVEIGTALVGEDGKWTFEPSQPLPFGSHDITVESVNAAGTSSAPSDNFEFVLEIPGAPPAPAITSVVDDVGSITGNLQKNAVTDDARPTINGTAQAGMTVSIYVDKVLVGSTVAAANGEWSFTPADDLADGVRNITATATNAAGNVSPETGKYPINVDTAVPNKPGAGDAQLIDDEGQIAGAISNGMETDDTTPTFKGKGEPNGTVIIYDNNKEIGRVPSDANGDWSFTPSPGLDNGEHSFNYEVVDQAGNVSEKSDPISFKVVDEGVEIRIEGITDNAGSVTGEIGKNGVTDDLTPTLHGKGTIGGTVKVYEGSELLGEAVVDAEGKWSFTPTTPLSEGAHSLTATVTTEANGESERSSAFDFTIDVSAPSKPSIDSISDDVGSIQGKLVNGQDTDDTTPTLAGKAEAGSTVKIYDNGGLLGSVVADANGNWGFTPTTPLTGGTHEFTVAAVDKAGNASGMSDAFAINIDTIVPNPPVILSVYDDAGDVHGELVSGANTDDAKPLFSGTAEANTTVVIKDKGVEIGRAPVDADGKWSFEPSIPLLTGTHEITVEAVDKAGNTSQPSASFELAVVSSVAPAEPAITSVVDDVGSITGNLQKNAVTDDARPTINGTAEAGMTVTVYINGVASGTTVAAGNGQWSFTPGADLVDGLHNITAKATNGVGNSSTETGKYPINVDTTAPNKPGTGDAGLIDDEGQVTGAITDGMTTDDATPTTPPRHWPARQKRAAP